MADRRVSRPSRPLRVAVSMALFLLALACGCSEEGKAPASGNAPSGDGSPLVRVFRENHPGIEVLLTARADLDDDGREDVLVVYRVDPERNMMRVVLDTAGGPTETNEVPAPHSHQSVRLLDMDHKPPLEFIVQGMKGAKVGFAVFRVEGGVLSDLFGENMKDCC